MSITKETMQQRFSAAYWLAKATGEDFQACERVLSSLRRATNARVHTWEMENDARYNTPEGIEYLERRSVRTEKTLARIEAWLAGRGVALHFYGLYPTLECERPHRFTIEGLGF